MYWHVRNRLARALVIVLSVAIPVIVGWARMYRGMHHLTDVLAGVLLGIVSVVVSWWMIHRAIERTAFVVPRNRIGGDTMSTTVVVLLVSVLAGAVLVVLGRLLGTKRHPDDVIDPNETEHWLLERVKDHPRLRRVLSTMDQGVIGGAAVAVSFVGAVRRRTHRRCRVRHDRHEPGLRPVGPVGVAMGS